MNALLKAPGVRYRRAAAPFLRPRHGQIMIFHTVSYFLLLTLSVSLYFAMPHRGRWVVLLAASYWFYGSWRIDYLGLLILSTTIDYLCGLGLGRHERPAVRRAILATSLTANLGILCYFKYRLFFADMFGLVDAVGPSGASIFADIILPVGLSFYTLQSMGYTIDVYRRLHDPERHPGYFALYVAFFPQLVAGPIERSGHLLPQLRAPHRFDWDLFRIGGLLILFGLFKKLVVADNLSPVIGDFYAAPTAASPAEAWTAFVLGLPFVYLDFSAYTDMARGSAMLLGIDLTHNFNRPYKATSIRDFWRRWHISLSRWIHDYLYRPLVGCSGAAWWRNATYLIVFTLIGLWHGPAWTFVVFGFCQGLLVIAERACARLPLAWPEGRLWDLLRVVRTHFLFNLTFVAFLSPDLHTTWLALERLFAVFTEGLGDIARTRELLTLPAVAGLLSVGLAHYLVDRYRISLAWILTWPQPLRWGFVYAAMIIVLALQTHRTATFVYFQF